MKRRQRLSPSARPPSVSSANLSQPRHPKQRSSPQYPNLLTRPGPNPPLHCDQDRTLLDIIAAAEQILSPGPPIPSSVNQTSELPAPPVMSAAILPVIAATSPQPHVRCDGLQMVGPVTIQPTPALPIKPPEQLFPNRWAGPAVCPPAASRLSKRLRRSSCSLRRGGTHRRASRMPRSGRRWELPRQRPPC